MKKASLVLLFCLVCGLQLSYGQKEQLTEISYLKLTDTALIDGINKVVKQEENNPNDPLFKKGLGYINVSVQKYSKNDTVIVYYIAPQAFSIRQRDDNQVYPDYYSFVNGRLVLIKLPVLEAFTSRAFTEKSKKLIRELINDHLDKPVKIRFPDANGKKGLVNEQRGGFVFGGGMELYVFKNKPAVLKRPTYY